MKFPPPYYTLDADNNPIKAATVLEWGEFMEDHARTTVARTHFPDHQATVSTIFVGLDNSWGAAPTPTELFETMAFQKGAPCGERIRYDTWKEAEAGHKAAVVALVSQLPIQGVRIQLSPKEEAIS